MIERSKPAETLWLDVFYQLPFPRIHFICYYCDAYCDIIVLFIAKQRFFIELRLQMTQIIQ